MISLTDRERLPPRALDDWPGCPRGPVFLSRIATKEADVAGVTRIAAPDVGDKGASSRCDGKAAISVSPYCTARMYTRPQTLTVPGSGAPAPGAARKVA